MKNEVQVVDSDISELTAQVREIVLSARRKVKAAVNFAMVEAYWLIGKSIVERQGGAGRSEYGDRLIDGLSGKLTTELGAGFTRVNLFYMRRFFLAFPIVHALREQLGWTHYRQLLSVKDEKARLWYMNEAAECDWSSRQLARQISVLYYERMLASQDKADTRADALANLAKDAAEYPLTIQRSGCFSVRRKTKPWRSIRFSTNQSNFSPQSIFSNCQVKMSCVS